MSNRPGPLSGIHVVDFGHYIATPQTGMLLADQGADVIKLGRSCCRQSKELPAAVLNRNKRSVRFDLKQDTAVDKAIKLAQSTDVPIEIFVLT